MKTLRDYQEKSLRVFSRSTGSLDGSDLGTGKTLVAVERLRQIPARRGGHRVLVVAPVNTHLQWKAAFAEQYPSLDGSAHLRIIGTHRTDTESWEMIQKKAPGVYIIGWEAMRGMIGEELRRESNSRGTDKLTVAAVKSGMKQGKIPPWHRSGTWDLVIADEVHRITRRDSANALVLKKIESVHRHGASATFAGNRIDGAWSVLNWLWKDQYRNFWEWAEAFLEIEEEKIYGAGGQEITKRKIVGEKDPGSTWLDVPCKIRHRVEDVRKELPDVIERTVTVPMTDEQLRIYNEFDAEYTAWVARHNPETREQLLRLITTPSGIERRTRLRQAALGTLVVASEDPKMELGYHPDAPCPKVDAIREILADLPADEPVIVWSHSRKWITMAADRLKKAKVGPVRTWTGLTTPKNRQIYKETLGSGCRVMICQIQAVAEGVDGLQRSCAAEIWASVMDGDVVANVQAEGRLNRDGQKRPVQRWHLHSENSIDTDINLTLALREYQLGQFYRDHQKEGNQ